MKARLLLPLLVTASAFAAEPPVPTFRAVTLDDQIQIGYGLTIADVDGDKRPDILLADKRQIVWYRNPTGDPQDKTAKWQKHLLAENLTEKDNVCIAAQDIDGDGKCEIAIGAEWNPGDTEKSGAVFYLQAPADRTQLWTPIRFPDVEPTTHRMRWIRLGKEEGGGGKAEGERRKAEGKQTAAPSALPPWGLLILPLHGRGNKNGEGAPVKVLLYLPPASLLGGTPASGTPPELPWKSEVVDESLHLTHNFARLTVIGQGLPDSLLIGGKEGLIAVHRIDGKWVRTSQPAPAEAPGGIGEIRVGSFVNGEQFIATVQPMHGNSLVAYVPRRPAKGPLVIERRVLTDRLVDGHALACGNLLGGYPGISALDQVVVGWRGRVGTPGSTTGVAVWTPLDAQGEQWRETVIDPDGMACEDLQLADLDGDGRLDIVAAGRATRNVKIYFNTTTPAGQ